MTAADYKEETDALLKVPGFHMGMLAERLGVSRNTVNRARMDGRQSRPPPKGWERALSDIILELAEQAKQDAIYLHRRGRALKAKAEK